MKPKYTPAETQRQMRLMSLYSWGRSNLKKGPYDDKDAGISRMNAEDQLMAKALEMFGVSTYTARNYASVVYYRLKKDGVKANDS